MDSACWTIWLAPPEGLRHVRGVRRWIATNMLGEGVAMGVSALLGALVSRLPLDVASVAFVLPILMVLTGTIEGLVLGGIQSTALRVSKRRWTWATGGAFGVVWALGAITSLFDGGFGESRATTFLFAGLAGALLGSAVGWAQNRAHPMEGHLVRSVLAWTCALIVMAMAAEMVPYGAFGLGALAINVAGGAVAGLCVGVATWDSVSPLAR